LTFLKLGALIVSGLKGVKKGIIPIQLAILDILTSLHLASHLSHQWAFEWEAGLHRTVVGTPSLMRTMVMPALNGRAEGCSRVEGRSRMRPF